MKSKKEEPKKYKKMYSEEEKEQILSNFIKIGSGPAEITGFKVTDNYEKEFLNSLEKMKEELKQETPEEVAQKFIDRYDIGSYNTLKHIGKELSEEEAAERYFPDIQQGWIISVQDRQREGFIAGAKWQAKRMYSEEEVLKILYEWSMYKINTAFSDEDVLVYTEWFEQFKKK